jgi:peptidoglycan hydrolase-like protein with peptidoglycan-binding domain
MDKKKKILVVVLVAVCIVAFIFWPKKMVINPDELPTDGGLDPNEDLGNNDTTVTTNLPPPSSFPLKRGSQGNLIINLQQFINFNDSAYNNTNGQYLVQDGKFGPATEARVIKLFGSKTVTEKQYQDALAKYRLNIPLQSLRHDDFPLRLGSHGNRVVELNFSLGVYPNKAHSYSKNFTAKTMAALKAKTGHVSSNAAMFTQLTNKPANFK